AEQISRWRAEYSAAIVEDMADTCQQLFTITPHYAHRSNALETILGRNPLNPTSYPLKTPQNRSRAFYGHELLCTRLTGGGFQPEFRPDNSKPAPNQTENGERGRNLLRGREALPAQPENSFSA
ncbi:hypothetical protein ACTXQV_47345, partial [Klebsiella pneumoniae]